MHSPDLSHISIDRVDFLLLKEKNVELNVLRLDKIHETISGNKYFKLKYYLKEAKQSEKNHIVTFGGAWSNHIIAVAAATHLNGMKSTGIIRGEEPPLLSPTLLQAKELGMQLIFISREDYKEKKLPDVFHSKEYYIIPEGGYGPKGAKGSATITSTFSLKDYTHIICAVGTGTMIAGIINASLPGQQVIGISVLKNNFDADNDIRNLLEKTSAGFSINHNHHFGGYAKYDDELIRFMNDFYTQTEIPSDFVYTGKLFYAVIQLIKENYFPPDSKILAIHSGGLQGNASLGKGTLIF